MASTTLNLAPRAHEVIAKDESRSHLLMSILIFMIEVTSILQVEAWVFHLLLASLLFGQEVTEVFITAAEGVIADF